MGYYTTIKVINSRGKPVKAAVYCGGKFRGYTNENTGEIIFELPYSGKYSLSVERYGDKVSTEIISGQESIIRI